MKRTAFLLIALFSVFSAFSQHWNRIYPSAPGIFYQCFSFADRNTGFAVGDSAELDYGVIYRTVDGGRNWKKLFYGNEKDISLRSVFAVRNDNGRVTVYAGGFNGVLLKTNDGGDSWKSIRIDSSFSVESLYFTDPETGFAAGSYTDYTKLLEDPVSYESKAFIMKTTDGGKSWTTFFFDGFGFSSLVFTDSITGFAAGFGGNVYKTFTAGKEWIKVETGIYTDFTAVSFPGKDTGYIAGDGNDSSYVIKTTDGGKSWVKIFTFEDSWITGCRFVTNYTGFVTGMHGEIFKTINGGKSWIKQHTETDLWLYPVFFTDSLCGFTGGGDTHDEGIMLMTTDGGENWIPANSLLNLKPNAIFINKTVNPDQNVIYAVGNSGIIMETITGGEYWNHMNSGTDLNLHAVVFTDINRGFIAGDYGLILRTTDEGRSWKKISTPATRNLNALYFTSAKTGFAAGEYGTILQTNDSGQTWIPLQTKITTDINALYFRDSAEGYAVGCNGIILKTTNSGKSWNRQFSGTILKLNSVCFTRDLKGFESGIIAGDSGLILKTTNGGKTWIKLKSGTGKKLFSVMFGKDTPAPLTGYISGENGIILKTTDGGNIWFRMESGTSRSLTCVYPAPDNSVDIFGDSMTILTETVWTEVHKQEYTYISSMFCFPETGRKYSCFAVGFDGNILFEPDTDPVSNRQGVFTGLILKSSEEDTTWEVLSRPDSVFFLNSVFMTNENTIYVAGKSGTLYKSSNGGKSWLRLNSGTKADLNSVFFTDSSTGYIAGSNNFDFDFQDSMDEPYLSNIILKTTDGGKKWIRQECDVSAELVSIFFIKDNKGSNTGYIAGNYGTILKTTDGGIHWRKENTGINFRLNSIYFINDNIGSETGYAVGEYGTILKTMDGGMSWFSLNSGTGLNLNSICFLNKDTGFVTGYDVLGELINPRGPGGGVILKTTDAGRTWVRQPSGSFEGFTSVVFPNQSTGFVAGKNGIILKVNY